MRIVWEAKDIVGAIIVGRQDCNERWLISYIVGSDTRYTLTSLSDGMVAFPEGMRKDDLARHLTDDRLVPVDFFTTDTARRIASYGSQKCPAKTRSSESSSPSSSSAASTATSG